VCAVRGYPVDCALSTWPADPSQSTVRPSSSRLPMRAIQELAGHQDLGTTLRYMHVSPAAIEGAIRLLDQRAPQLHSGDKVETARLTAENVNRKRGDVVAGAGFEPASFGL
jgi:hypothetical protein